MRRFLLTQTFLLATLLLPVFLHAAGLVNINTADAALLETLPGIGATKAAAIVDYRTEHGAFAKISDIQNVSGIGPSTYAQLEASVTVGDAPASSEILPTSSSTTPASSGTVAVYQPPGNKLTVVAEPDFVAVLNVPHRFSAYAKTTSGSTDLGASLHWSFGDGSEAFGSSVEKTFTYAGTYVVTVTATDGSARGFNSMTVAVQPTVVRIDSVSNTGVMIANDSDEPLDLGGWRISTEQGFFKIPEGTALAANTKVLFPWSNLGLPIAFSAQLLYPSGLAAVAYRLPETMPASPVQPEAVEKSSHIVQTTATVDITNQHQAVHEAAGALAPTTTSELAAVGATQSPDVEQEASSKSGGMRAIMSSPWSLGFLGMLAVSVGAFILL